MKFIRFLISLGAISIAAIFAGCNPTTPQTKSAETPVSVKLIQPHRGEITRTISLPAVIAANQQAALYSKVAGFLKSISVDKGDAVTRGQLLAEIEVPELVADLARYKAEAEIADLDFKRASEAREKSPDIVPLQSADAAKAKSLEAKANLEHAQTLLGFCKITAPFNGVITRRTADPGAFVPAGAAQNSAVVTLADFDVVRVQIAVPESEVPLIKNSLPAKILVDELPGHAFDGGITRFSQTLDDTSRTMLAEVDLQNPKHELRPGMFATVKLGVEKHANALLVPADAVAFEKAGTSVFTVADGKAKKLPVKTGFNDGSSVEILDGLASEQAIVLLGKMTLNNGQAVTISQ
jgi:membrane fusion protein (multidrug efflux system)